MDTVTVYHNGNGLSLQKVVADELGHYSGKELTEAEFWEASFATAAAVGADCLLDRARRAQEGKADAT